MNENKLEKIKPITCTIGVRMPVLERAAMDEFCETHDISLSHLVRVAVREFMRQHADDNFILS